MFGSLRRTFGLVKVYETATDIVVSGVPADIIARDISKIWSTSRIDANMFTSRNRSGFSFPKFFGLEVHYMLQQIDAYRYSKTSIRTIRHILDELETNTWLKRLNEEPVSRVDLSQLSHLNAKLFDHQNSFLTAYGELVERYDLNGYLLAAEPGTGKAQPLDAPIRVPGGWSTMGEMTVGTKVIAKDGSVTEVIGVYPQGEKRIYRVTFADGRTTECCGEHLWKVKPADGEYQILATETIAKKVSEGEALYIPLIDPESGADSRFTQLESLLSEGESVNEGSSSLHGCHYHTPDEAKARQVQQLVWSLGGIATLMPKADASGFSVRMRYRKPGSAERALKLKIVSIEAIGTKEAQCIAIAHPEHLYVTGDYIVTHNTIMGLALAECLHADLIVVVSPKNALHRVWTSTIDWLYKKPQKYWVAASGLPYKHERIIVTHYEALAKALAAAKSSTHQRAVVILDESHNLNEAKSNRTQLFLDLCKAVRAQNVLWSSGTPLKAMGYEMIPLLRSIDPLFTENVEQRFLKIFGKASDRALDILRNRIGKVSYHVSGAEVIDVKKSYQTWKIEIPNAEEYTLEAIKEKMRTFVAARLKHYKDEAKSYRKAYDAGLAAYEKGMSSEDAKDYKRYQRAIRDISRGYDPKLHKDEAVFANQFELKTILPTIPDKATRDGFKNARSVIKYAHLKVLGEALGSVVGKARSQCQIDMAKHTDWSKVAHASEKKVIVFTSYVDVVKAIEADVRKAGYKSLLVYGDTNANVANLVNQFGQDDKIKFMIATFQSLSTAVPLTMADVTVFSNLPWRSFELEQAEARTARIGQDSAVQYITTLLDTGSKPNISTRSKDILEWSREQVTAMIGREGGEGIASELNKDYLAGAMEAFKHYGDNPNLLFDLS